jgi:hypothetical protein
MISKKQAEVKGAITTADRQLIVLENKLEELNISSDDGEVARPEEVSCCLSHRKKLLRKPQGTRVLQPR